MAVSDSVLVRALQDSLAAVEAADIPEELRPIAFSKAFDFVTRDSPATTSSVTGAASSRTNGDRGGAGDESDPIATIAAKVGVDAELVSRVYDVDDEGVHLTISRSSLNEKKRFAMQEVARLIMAARQALGLEDFTPAKIIREACDGRGVLDSGNFATALSGIDGHGVRLRGSGAAREGKLNAVGFEAAGEDIKRIVGA